MCVSPHATQQDPRAVCSSLKWCKCHWPALKMPPSALQGDLGDPLYFDFIAFSQFAAISAAMESGRQEFEVRPPLLHAHVDTRKQCACQRYTQLILRAKQLRWAASHCLRTSCDLNTQLWNDVDKPEVTHREPLPTGVL